MNSLLELATTARDEHGSQQKPTELVHLAELVFLHHLKSAVEVGTYAGGTAWFLKELGMGVVAVDQSLANVKENNRDITYVQAASHEYARQLAWTDLIFIDADHSYAAVKQDFEAFLPKISVGGALVLHDIAVHPPELNCYVSDLWVEVKDQHLSNSFEWIEEPADWGGMGVVLQ
jgi:predicted O-methyltransferase YrrM